MKQERKLHRDSTSICRAREGRKWALRRDKAEVKVKAEAKVKVKAEVKVKARAPDLRRRHIGLKQRADGSYDENGTRRQEIRSIDHGKDIHSHRS
ncbi:MAG TPA: hypothetical protein IAB10_03115 [Candidatus Avilachnospira avistercoris]|nr:hypothetical protein [Candidatus Avilachnospira avistercoris]